MRMTIDGHTQGAARLRRLASQFPRRAMVPAVYAVTEEVVTTCKEECPVKTGTLRGTIHQEGPEVSGSRVETSIVAGGPAAPYAWSVHETHRTKPKFIENPLNVARSSFMSRVASRLDVAGSL